MLSSLTNSVVVVHLFRALSAATSSQASIELKTVFRHHAPKRHIGILTPAAACTYRVWNVATLF